MSEALPSLKDPFRVPWWVWVALVPVVLIGLNQLRKGGRQRIELAGAGPVHLLKAEDAPKDLRYYPQTVAHASVPEAQAQIIDALLIQPAVMVFSLDLSAWRPTEGAQEDLRRVYNELHRRSENAATIAVSIGPWLPASADPQAREAIREVREQWRQGPCQRAKRLLCVDLGEETDEAEMKQSLQAAIVHAVARLNAVRATTQRGR